MSGFSIKAETFGTTLAGRFGCKGVISGTWSESELRVFVGNHYPIDREGQHQYHRFTSLDGRQKDLDRIVGECIGSGRDPRPSAYSWRGPR